MLIVICHVGNDVDPIVVAGGGGGGGAANPNFYDKYKDGPLGEEMVIRL